MADLLVMSLGGVRFTWGSANLHDASDTRRQYISALRAVDQREIQPLLRFARS